MAHARWALFVSVSIAAGCAVGPAPIADGGAPADGSPPPCDEGDCDLGSIIAIAGGAPRAIVVTRGAVTLGSYRGEVLAHVVSGAGSVGTPLELYGSWGAAVTWTGTEHVVAYVVAASSRSPGVYWHPIGERDRYHGPIARPESPISIAPAADGRILLAVDGGVWITGTTEHAIAGQPGGSAAIDAPSGLLRAAADGTVLALGRDGRARAIAADGMPIGATVELALPEVTDAWSSALGWVVLGGGRAVRVALRDGALEEVSLADRPSGVVAASSDVALIATEREDGRVEVRRAAPTGEPIDGPGEIFVELGAGSRLAAIGPTDFIVVEPRGESVLVRALSLE